MTLFAVGVKVQWKTFDGSVHKGVVKRMLPNGEHAVLEEVKKEIVTVPVGMCSRVKEKKKRKVKTCEV